MGKTNRHHQTVVLLVRLKFLGVLDALYTMKLDKLNVGLQYDMMELIKHSNAENKVRKGRKGENTYSMLA